jgi:hypothetical protein
MPVFITHDVSRALRGVFFRALVLGVMAISACDADPTINGDFEGSPATPHDNPLITGVQDARGQTWRYADLLPNDPLRPASTRQTVWADASATGVRGQLLEFSASAPIFAGRMVRSEASFASLIPSGTSELFESLMSTTSVPWQWLPVECRQLTDPACASYLSRPFPNQEKPLTIPFALGNVHLPATAVTIAAISKVPVRSGTGWNTTDVLLNTITMQLDPAVLVVPVWVHIFTRNNGDLGHSFMAGMQNSDAGRLAMATRIRAVFDDYAVNIVSRASQSSNLDWHREYTTEMTRNPIVFDPAPPPTVFDHMIDNCKVQVRLAGVNFIRQGDGLESATVGYGNGRQQTPAWPDPLLTPADVQMQRIATLFNAYLTGVNSVAGAHVFVVGAVNTGAFTNFDPPQGIGFSQVGTRVGYAVLGGKSNANASVAGARTGLMHEVGHVLGLRHSDAAPVEELFPMFEDRLTVSMCDRMKQESAKLLVPASQGH